MTRRPHFPKSASNRALGSLLLVLASVFAGNSPAQAQFWGWSEGKTTQGSGQSATQERTVGGFDKIQLSSQFEVVLRQGAKPSLTLECDDNLLPLIQTEVSNGTLSVYSNVQMRSKSKILVTITFSDLKVLSMGGSGKVEMDDAKLEQLVVNQGGSVGVVLQNLNVNRLVMNAGGSSNIRIDSLQAQQVVLNLGGSARINATGKTKDLSVNVGGSGSVRANGLAAQDVSASVGGSGNVRITALKTLRATVSGSGHIGYSGDAAVTQSISGSGSIKKAAE